MITNEIAFFIQLFFVGFFLYNFAKKEHVLFLESAFLIFFFIINLFSNFEVEAFSFFITSIEPITIGMYFLGIILYSLNKEKQDNLIKNLFKINLLIIGTFATLSFYNIEKPEFNLLVNNVLYNFSISFISFWLSYSFERKIYEIIKKNLSTRISQTISVICSQLLDTAFYTSLIFYNQPFKVIKSIFFFSYIVKLLCILTYFIFLLFNANQE